MDVPFVRFVLNRPTIARYGLASARCRGSDRDEPGRRDGRTRSSIGAIAFDLVVRFDAAAGAEFDRIADLPIDRRQAGRPCLSGCWRRSGANRGPNMVLPRERAASDRDLRATWPVAIWAAWWTTSGGRVSAAVPMPTGLPRGVRRAVRERAECVPAAAGLERRLSSAGRVHAARAGVRLGLATPCIVMVNLPLALDRRRGRRLSCRAAS